MALLVLVLFLLSFVLFLTRKNRETALIWGMTAALSLHWMTVLTYIAKKGGRVILNSDAHSTSTLLYQFDKWEKYARDAGIRAENILTSPR